MGSHRLPISEGIWTPLDTYVSVQEAPYHWLSDRIWQTLGRSIGTFKSSSMPWCVARSTPIRKSCDDCSSWASQKMSRDASTHRTSRYIKTKSYLKIHQSRSQKNVDWVTLSASLVRRFRSVKAPWALRYRNDWRILPICTVAIGCLKK